MNVPVKKVDQTAMRKNPWITKSTKRKILRRNKARKLYRTLPTETNYGKYKLLRNEANKQIKEDHANCRKKILKSGATISVRIFTWFDWLIEQGLTSPPTQYRFTRLSCLNVHYCLWSCDLFTLLAFKQIKKESLSKGSQRDFTATGGNWNCEGQGCSADWGQRCFVKSVLDKAVLTKKQLRHWRSSSAVSLCIKHLCSWKTGCKVSTKQTILKSIQ